METNDVDFEIAFPALDREDDVSKRVARDGKDRENRATRIKAAKDSKTVSYNISASLK